MNVYLNGESGWYTKLSHINSLNSDYESLLRLLLSTHGFLYNINLLNNASDFLTILPSILFLYDPLSSINWMHSHAFVALYVEYGESSKMNEVKSI